MKEIVIRSFTLDILSECSDLYMKTYSQEPWNERWSSRDVVDDFYRNHFTNNYFLGFVAYKDESVIGVCVGFLKPWIKGMEYYIDDFFVRSDYQGQGIGSEFLALVKSELVSQNIHAIILSTQRGYPAHKFYEKMGFSVLEDTIFLGIEI